MVTLEFVELSTWVRFPYASLISQGGKICRTRPGFLKKASSMGALLTSANFTTFGESHAAQRHEHPRILQIYEGDITLS